jgi:hypothetical protein
VSDASCPGEEIKPRESTGEREVFHGASVTFEVVIDTESLNGCVQFLEISEKR